jgi:hypothetical protein
MLYTILSATLALLAVLIIFVALKILFGRPWFRAWLRGTTSILAILCSLLIVAFAWDFLTYNVIAQDKAVATVSVIEIGKQEYQLDVALPDGESSSYKVKGDLWQLDARLISWAGLMGMIGLEPGYRLDRLSGRYISLEQERNAERTVYNIKNDYSVIDVWSVINNNAWLPWISAKYGSATYLPMKDGALYSVALTQQGLIARPLNESAEKAIDTWY